MARYHYYGAKDNYVWHFSSNTHPRYISWYQPKLIENSDVVWCQGVRGGVRLVYINWEVNKEFRKYGYITMDPEAMKEFAWIKLQARDLN